MFKTTLNKISQVFQHFDIALESQIRQLNKYYENKKVIE